LHSDPMVLRGDPADHTVSQADHTVSQADHTLGQSDHTLGQADHTLGQADHTLGQADHTLGQADHTLGQADYTLRPADHTVSRRITRTITRINTRGSGYKISHCTLPKHRQECPCHTIQSYSLMPRRVAKFFATSRDRSTPAPRWSGRLRCTAQTERSQWKPDVVRRGDGVGEREGDG
jgi:hypothetical protein